MATQKFSNVCSIMHVSTPKKKKYHACTRQETALLPKKTNNNSRYVTFKVVDSCNCNTDLVSFSESGAEETEKGRERGREVKKEKLKTWDYY